MSSKEYKEFIYLEKEDYDKKIKINEDDLRAYSKKKLKDLYPDGKYVIAGETFERKKRDKKKDIGKITLNERPLYVTDGACKLFRRRGAFVQTEGGGFIAILKIRILPIILIITLLLGGIGCGAWGIFKGESTPAVKQDDIIDPGIKKAETDIITISGRVTKNGSPLEGVGLSLQKGNEEVDDTVTDKNGDYLLSDVTNGNYNLVCTYEDSVLTKIATVNGESVEIDFRFPADDLDDVEEITEHHEKENLPKSTPTKENTDVKALVKVPKGTSAVAVGGLEAEAMLHMIVGKEVDLTFLAEMLSEEMVPSEDKAAITSISGELKLCYFDFSILKEIFKDSVLESSEYLKNTKTVLEIALPYDSSMSVGTYVFRYVDGDVARFEELSEKPADNFKDGTYFFTADTVYIYISTLGTFAIGSASAGHVVRGSDTLTYSDKATINLSTGKIEMLYQHGTDSTNDARVELYIIGENGNLLVAESGTIPVGYEISEMALLSDINNMPSVGTYNGLMKVIYIGIDSDTSTNVDIPISIAITQ